MGQTKMKKTKKQKSPTKPQSARKYAVKEDPKKPKRESPYKLPQGNKISLDVEAPKESDKVIKARKNQASPYRLEPDQIGTSLLKKGKSKEVLPPKKEKKTPIIGAGSPIGVPPPNVVARYRRIMAEKEARRARSRSPVPLEGTGSPLLSGKKGTPPPPGIADHQLKAIVSSPDGNNVIKPKALTPEQLKKQEHDAKVRAKRRLSLMNDYKLQYQKRYEEMKSQLKKKHMDEIRRRKEAVDAAKILESGRQTAIKKQSKDSSAPPKKKEEATTSGTSAPSNEGKTTKELDAFEQAKSWSEQVANQKQKMKQKKPMTKEEKKRYREKMMNDYKAQHKQMRRELKERLKRKHLAELKLIHEERERRLQEAEKLKKEEERKKKLPKPVKYAVKSGEKKPKAKLITIVNNTPEPPQKKEVQEDTAATTGKSKDEVLEKSNDEKEVVVTTEKEKMTDVGSKEDVKDDETKEGDVKTTITTKDETTTEKNDDGVKGVGSSKGDDVKDDEAKGDDSNV